MGILEDVMKALERIPAWKRLNAMPQEMAALEARIRALEEKLKPATGSKCPKCGVMSLALEKSQPAPPPWGAMGAREDHYRCTHCGYTDVRQRDPGQAIG
jgi:predicted RNA-binding Zn-ribbon protein involved in translation (DUF1610 family)